MNEFTATVEALTAEVRVLMVGKRQVTLSVYRQLDWVEPTAIEPFGRVQDPKEKSGISKYQQRVYVIGRDRRDGALVRANDSGPSIEFSKEGLDLHDDNVRRGYPHVNFERRKHWEDMYDEAVDTDARLEAWRDLPLIILAGLT